MSEKDMGFTNSFIVDIDEGEYEFCDCDPNHPDRNVVVTNAIYYKCTKCGRLIE